MAENSQDPQMDEQAKHFVTQKLLPHYIEMVESLFQDDPDQLRRDDYNTYLENMHLGRMNNLLDEPRHIEDKIKDYLHGLPFNGSGGH